MPEIQANRPPAQQNEDASRMDTDRTGHRTRDTQFLVNVEITLIAGSYWQTVTFSTGWDASVGDRS